MERAPLDDHLDGVGPPGRDQHGWLAVGQREVRDDDGALLLVTAVGPVADRGLQPSAELGLDRPVGAPRHHRALQAPQDEVAEERLTVLLAHPGNVTAVGGGHRTAGELLGGGEQAAPLALQQVHHVQVFALLLGQRSLG